MFGCPADFTAQHHDSNCINNGMRLPSGTAQLILALHEAPIICRPSGVTTNPAQSRPALWRVLRSGQALPAQFWGFRLLS
jgi:hypothetical protein